MIYSLINFRNGLRTLSLSSLDAPMFTDRRFKKIKPTVLENIRLGKDGLLNKVLEYRFKNTNSKIPG